MIQFRGMDSVDPNRDEVEKWIDSFDHRVGLTIDLNHITIRQQSWPNVQAFTGHYIVRMPWGQYVVFDQFTYARHFKEVFYSPTGELVTLVE